MRNKHYARTSCSRAGRPQRSRLPSVAALGLGLVSQGLAAQESDITLTPNPAGAGIKKSLADQIGAGRGDATTVDSSIYLIERDPFRSIQRGRQLFQRKFRRVEGLGPRTGDGAGDIVADRSIVAGLADSCAACHGRPRGSAGSGGDVFTRPDSRDAPHLFGLGLIEMLADEITADLRAIRDRALADATATGTPVTTALVSKGIDYGQLTANPDGTLATGLVTGVDPDLRVKPFFAEGSSFAIRQFVVGALNDEMGLESPDPVLLAASQGQAVTTPAGMVLDGTQDVVPAPPVTDAGADADQDGVVNEIDPALVDHLEFYLLNYFKPGTYQPEARIARRGRNLMTSLGCTACHTPDLTIERDRRVADVDTTYDPDKGIFNRLFAEASERIVVADDAAPLPPRVLPSEDRFVVENLFTDFRRHDLGPNFWERDFDGSLRTEFMTEPLWGVGTTGHDGRSINLREVILRHGGEAEDARNQFAALNPQQQERLLAFLDSLVLFPPPDTASNLDPGDPGDPDFPQSGHGSIALQVLFNDPSDPE